MDTGRRGQLSSSCCLECPYSCHHEDNFVIFIYMTKSYIAMTTIRHSRQQLEGGLTPPSSITRIVIVTKINKKINTFTFNKLYIFRCINNSHL